MCAAEDGHLEEALHHMEDAENKVGRTQKLSVGWPFVGIFLTRKNTMHI